MWHSEQNLASCLRIVRSQNVGPQTFQMLMHNYASPREALEAMPTLSARGGHKNFKLAAAGQIDAEIATTIKLGGQYLIWGAPLYPRLLAETAGAPSIISIFGHPALLKTRALAVVGARNASAAALTLCARLCAELGRRGWVGVSGLARGIDTACHKAMIESGTIAVIANGIDVYYPPENAHLQDRIKEAGLLICENPPGTQPQAIQFPRRNRIIAGLGLGTLVVEAARRSGSLITARLANEFGRDVFAVPGSPLDPRCLGSNNLIREGAGLVETADDIETAMSLNAGQFEARPPHPLNQRPVAPPDLSDGDRNQIHGLLGPTAVSINELIELTDMPLPYIYQALLELELAGILIRQLDGKVSLTPPS
jgi:DNA processing protein